MKIIDRYVLGSFIKNYLISFMVLIGMYIALDMVFNFANLTQSHGQNNLSFWQVIYDIADYYFYNSFLFFTQLSGMIAVVAAAFTLMRLSRFNETTALLAAGTPLLRIGLSIILAGVAINLVLLPIDQEYIVPRMIPKLVRDHNDVHRTSIRSYPVWNMRDDRGALFSAALFIPEVQGPSDTPARVLDLSVVEEDDQFRPTAYLHADSATWNASMHRWDLINGTRRVMHPPTAVDAPADPVESPEKVAIYRSNINPDEIALNLGKDYIQLLPAARIDQLLERNRYQSLDLLRTKHLRFAQPLANVIMLLLAISTVLTRDPSRLKSAAARCMFLTGLCMGSVFLAYQLAGTPPAGTVNYWPALMAWMPIFLFGPLAALFLDHVKT